MSQRQSWSVRVLVNVHSHAPLEELIDALSRTLAELGQRGGWGGDTDPPASGSWSIGALLHVDTMRVGQAAERAVEVMREACAAASILVDDVVEVTVSCPTLAPAALRRN